MNRVLVVITIALAALCAVMIVNNLRRPILITGDGVTCSLDASGRYRMCDYTP